MDKASKAFLDLCARFKVDSTVFAAIISVESSWRTYAFRYEPGFYYTENVEKMARAHGITEASERVLQKSSFGLSQIMGGTARSIGYRGTLTALFQPETNLEWGLKYFAFNAKRYTQVTDMIAAYNAGSAKKDIAGKYFNQDYVDKVLAAMEPKK